MYGCSAYKPHINSYVTGILYVKKVLFQEPGPYTTHILLSNVSNV